MTTTAHAYPFGNFKLFLYLIDEVDNFILFSIYVFNHAIS